MTSQELEKTIFILGAQDGEMREIEKTLQKHGIRYAHAASRGSRCDSSKAYAADSVVFVGKDGQSRAALLTPNQPACFVECSIEGRPPQLRVDHHNEGDPGYYAPPELYMEGSSLGQTLSLFGAEPTSDQRLLAAADHCLTAAYAGRCPGVDVDELLFMRAAWQSLMTRRSLNETMTGIMEAGKLVKARFDPKIGASVFADPTRMPRDLPEGAAYAGLPVIYRGMLPGGELKEMIKGAEPDGIKAFMAKHAELGRRVYGNPYRGYAGAYF